MFTCDCRCGWIPAFLQPRRLPVFSGPARPASKRALPECPTSSAACPLGHAEYELCTGQNNNFLITVIADAW